jgi:hypothetical protein
MSSNKNKSKSKLLNKYNFYENALFIKELRTIVVSDLHIGLEFSLEDDGIQFPLNEEKLLLNRFEKIISKFNPKSIIFNGDILHSFSSITYKIRSEFRNIINFISNEVDDFIFIKGSHDTMLENLVKSTNFKPNYYKKDGYLFTHGNLAIEIEKNIKNIIIGHEHPCVEINMERVHCFLYQKNFNHKANIIILPAFNPLIKGVIITNQDFTSPLLKKSDPKLFQPILSIDHEILIFPSLSNLKLLQWET